MFNYVFKRNDINSLNELDDLIFGVFIRKYKTNQSKKYINF